MILSFFLLFSTCLAAGRQSDTPLVAVPSGSYVRGDSDVTLPMHTIRLSKGLEIGRYEVTNREYADALQWALDVGRARRVGSFILDDVSGERLIQVNEAYSEIYCDEDSVTVRRCGAPWLKQMSDVEYNVDRHPVHSVTWYGAAAYCNWESERHGLAPLYDTANGWRCRETNAYSGKCIRLPTEAEWEASARGPENWEQPWNLETSGARRGSPGQPVANHNGLWTTAVGAFSPRGDSGFGVSDAIGNVWEWTADWLAPYSVLEVEDPQGPAIGSRRVLRGGSYERTRLIHFNAACRGSAEPSAVSRLIGFRVARTQD